MSYYSQNDEERVILEGYGFKHYYDTRENLLMIK